MAHDVGNICRHTHDVLYRPYSRIHALFADYILQFIHLSDLQAIKEEIFSLTHQAAAQPHPHHPGAASFGSASDDEGPHSRGGHTPSEGGMTGTSDMGAHESAATDVKFEVSLVCSCSTSKFHTGLTKRHCGDKKEGGCGLPPPPHTPPGSAALYTASLTVMRETYWLSKSWQIFMVEM